ncbi:MAG: histidine phosphotransferase [Rhodospirillaceae bacterium]|nr:MAG: histidine phosphotransferase [Rhodospirillaceae bacterium]
MSSETEQELRLVELLCSRLCHDLVSPIGAIHNGLELLAENEPEMEKEILGLLIKSSVEASCRLRFFRVAFGQASGSTEMLPLEEGKGLLDGFLKEGRVALDWQAAEAAPSGPVAKGAVKLLLNMALIASEALPRGGAVSVVPVCHVDKNIFEVTARGEDAALKDEIVSALHFDLLPEKLTPRIAPACFLALLVRKYGFSLAVLPNSGSVTLRVTNTRKG